jgi:DNA-directed RNA polymerase specialized sigma24 family protein
LSRSGSGNRDRTGFDLELVSLAREGDERAFEEILRRYSPRVFSIAGKFFSTPRSGEDAAQEAF